VIGLRTLPGSRLVDERSKSTARSSIGGVPAKIRLPAIEAVVPRTLTATQRHTDYPQQKGDYRDDPQRVDSEAHAEKEQNY
jgi:hypothetical protein